MSRLEEKMSFHIRAAGLQEPAREFKFHPTRKWRFDFCWPDLKLALEVDGGTWGKSRHTTGAGFEKDCEKKNEAIILGWRVMTVTSSMINDGRALEFIERAIKEL